MKSFFQVNAPNGMEILSNIIRGVSCASGRSASFLDFLGGFKMAFVFDEVWINNGQLVSCE